MSRRRQATRRPIAKDGKFQSALVSRLVNTVMMCGKKSTAQRIVYGAFDTISRKKSGEQPGGNFAARGGQRQAAHRNQGRAASAAPRIRCRWRCRPTGRPRWPCAGLWISRTPARACPCATRSRRKFWKRIKGRGTPSASATKFTRWRRRTRLLPISAGRYKFRTCPEG